MKPRARIENSAEAGHRKSEVTRRNGSLKFLRTRRDEDGTHELFLFKYYENVCVRNATDLVILLAALQRETDNKAMCDNTRMLQIMGTDL